MKKGIVKLTQDRVEIVLFEGLVPFNALAAEVSNERGNFSFLWTILRLGSDMSQFGQAQGLLPADEQALLPVHLGLGHAVVSGAAVARVARKKRVLRDLAAAGRVGRRRLRRRRRGRGRGGRGRGGRGRGGRGRCSCRSVDKVCNSLIL